MATELTRGTERPNLLVVEAWCIRGTPPGQAWSPLGGAQCAQQAVGERLWRGISDQKGGHISSRTTPPDPPTLWRPSQTGIVTWGGGAPHPGCHWVGLVRELGLERGGKGVCDRFQAFQT